MFVKHIGDINWVEQWKRPKMSLSPKGRGQLPLYVIFIVNDTKFLFKISQPPAIH